MASNFPHVGNVYTVRNVYTPIKEAYIRPICLYKNISVNIMGCVTKKALFSTAFGMLLMMTMVCIFRHSRDPIDYSRSIKLDVNKDYDAEEYSMKLENITHIRYINNDIQNYVASVKQLQHYKIPHIIHQTWDDENVPQMFGNYIKSWHITHPDWEYWFWTPKSVTLMLETFYPKQLALYKDLTDELFKADLMRYFVMHKFGGIYADLDLASVRPLDNWTIDNDCILSENNFVHSFLAEKGNHAEVMITILAARPGHPYFKLAIDMLPIYKPMPNNKKTLYVDMVYIEYLKHAESKLPGNSITVAHPDFFLPTYDKGWTGLVAKMCRQGGKTSKYVQKTCDGLMDSTKGRLRKNFSYTDHYWEHVTLWGAKKALKKKISIHEVAPWTQDVTMKITEASRTE